MKRVVLVLCLCMPLIHLAAQEISGTDTVNLNINYTYEQDAGPCGALCDYFWEVYGPSHTIHSETEDSIVIEWSESGVATIELWMEHPYGTSFYDDFTVIVDDPPSVEYVYDAAGNRILRRVVYLSESVQKSLSNDNDFLNEIQSVESDRFNVYPNPTTQHVFVSMSEEACSCPDARILLFSSVGTLLLSRDVREQIMMVDLSSCSKGTYILKLIYQGKSKECKIIKY